MTPAMSSSLSTFGFGVYSTLGGALIAACAVLGFLLLRCVWKAYQLRHFPGPKPSSVLFGHSLETQGIMYKSMDTYPEPFLSWMNQYGGAIYLRESLTPTLLITDPVACQHLLVQNASNYPRQSFFQAYFEDTFFGPNVSTTNGAQHDMYKSLLMPLFSAKNVKAHVEIFEAHAQRCCDTVLTKFCKTKTAVDMKEVLAKLLLSTLGVSLLGCNVDEDPKTAKAFNDYLFVPRLGQFVSILVHTWYLYLPLPSLVQRQAARETLKQTLTAVMEKKQARLDAPRDLMDLVTPHLSKDETLAHAMMLLTGGHENGSTTLAWTFATLANHPKVVARIRHEYNSVLAKFGSLATDDAISHLTYTHAVVQETLRMHSPYLYRRVSVTGEQVPMAGGDAIYIPAGTSIRIQTAAMHRNPTYWTNPNAFVPERFMHGSAEWTADLALRGGKTHTSFYMPFGLGGMQCMASRYIMAEMKLVVATFIGRFNFDVASDADLAHRFNAFTIAPTKLKMNVHNVEACRM
ncbi:Aste57867_732 [Aphanomyces stellatus]|uniref:Aste57867_732 protein n=1 Tax=Aphanomyces stellatus TaxID=120398 RepID=A0A485K613_9STRA|nr:hypothetical protein As57867_000731 [Aphanomyces stellatus]VFT77956.1 Aste57867_732 [Aphanomyces stellatus]